MRKNIKFAMKRGEGLDKIKKNYFGQKGFTNDPKHLIKNWWFAFKISLKIIQCKIGSIILLSLRSPNTEKRLSFLWKGRDSLLIGLRTPFVKDAGLVRVLESSKHSEKLLATLDLIFHISTCLLGFIPSAHLSTSYNKFPTVQFHDLGKFVWRNFSRSDF